jgi:hypothetical protein
MQNIIIFTKSVSKALIATLLRKKYFKHIHIPNSQTGYAVGISSVWLRFHLIQFP